MKVQAFVLTTALALSTISVQAQPSGPPPGKGPGAMAERIKAADKNGDGFISREEAQASLPKVHENFDKMDLNRDGFISKEEFQKAGEARRAAMQAEHKAEMERRFAAADKDGNGRISREEAKASMPRVAERFDALDTDKDGQLTRDELAAGRPHGKGHGR